MRLVWNNQKYATGFDNIDRQHQGLFKAVNELLAACKAVGGSASQEAHEKALEIIDFLASYVIEHFRDEEELMEEVQSPMRIQNKAAHKHFLQKFEAMRGKIERHGLTRIIVVQLEIFLCGWLIEHIKKVDITLRDYV
jgi:hemerythrin